MDEHSVEVNLLDVSYTFSIKHEDQEQFKKVAAEFNRLLKEERKKDKIITRENVLVLVGLKLVSKLKNTSEDLGTSKTEQQLSQIIKLIDSSIQDLNNN